MFTHNHSGYDIRHWIGLALVLMALVCSLEPSSAALAGGSETRQAGLTLEARVAYQHAIEEVYWRHRIWPKENPKPKPALDEGMPLEKIRAKVKDYMSKSEALEQYWHRPITAKQLQAEMDRQARQTKQPEVLKELWQALGNDPYLIAECLARPALANRLIRNWYARDERYHGEVKRRAEAEVKQYGTVAQMRQMSGEYRDIEWMKGETARARHASPNADSVTLSAEQWDEKLRELEQLMGRGVGVDLLPINELSRLQEAEDRFYVMAVLELGKERVKVASVEWKKEPFDGWWKEAEEKVGMPVAGPVYAYRLPDLGSRSGMCKDDTWEPTFAFIVSARAGHTVVWTRSEMIVWGGGGGSSVFNTGGRYDPVTDSWVATSIMNAPSGRGYHTAVWTDGEMIVWGGCFLQLRLCHDINTGGRYEPVTDSWVATSKTNAPSPRRAHTAVWTGSEMIVWGGFESSRELDTGGRYCARAVK